MPARKKKSAKKTAKKVARGKAAKPRKAARPKRKAAKKRVSMAPKPVKTGRGASPLEVATQVMQLMREGRLGEVEEKWLAPGIESVEGVGASMAWTGKPAVLAKYRAWEAENEIVGMELEGPWVGATGFAVKMRVDVAKKATGERSQMEEVAVYTVRNGKIAREEFHFRVGG